MYQKVIHVLRSLGGPLLKDYRNSGQAALTLMLRAAACLWQSTMRDNTIAGGEDIITLEPRYSWDPICIRK